ncbi:hypothetical protein B0H17DRAFT_1163281 [Mycena rosella]|uniref:Uncharacterized protein n=1 Tax=Mycena rosella TaxID=1033263 RepID=A0AAD7G5L4_MYCRO|nr:hypothetical protein B0H17DRAFT_1163281 [Mycena rosella]
MAEFPVDPMLYMAIISGEKYVYMDEVLTVIAMLSGSGSLVSRPKDKKRMRIGRSRTRDIRDQLSNPNSNKITPVQKALKAGYFYNTFRQAQLQKSGDSHSTLIHFQRTLLSYELVMSSQSYMRQVMEIKPAWLFRLAPQYSKPSGTIIQRSAARAF